MVSDHFVVRVPEGLDPAVAAPLLCAGVATWSPLRRWKIGPGAKVGVVGLGGLGHMALKLAKGLGAEVTLFTRSPGKEGDARRLGADHVILSTDAAQMPVNPVLNIRRQSSAQGRNRRLSAAEEKKLFAAVDKHSNPMLRWIVRIAISETASAACSNWKAAALARWQP